MTTIVVDGLAFSGREQVASLLSRALGCPVVDSERLAELAAQDGHDPDVFMQRLEKPCSLWRRVSDFWELNLLYVARGTLSPHDFLPSSLLFWAYAPQGQDTLTDANKVLDKSSMKKLLCKLLTKETGQGHVVVVGCGAQGVLKDASNLVKIFLVASLKVRIMRAVHELGLVYEEAKRLVQKMDDGRRRFLRQVFGLLWNDPTNYDLVLDTGVVAYPEAAALTCKTALSRFDISVEELGLAQAGG